MTYYFESSLHDGVRLVVVLLSPLQEGLERGQWKAPTAADIVNSYRGTGLRLRPEDIIVQVSTTSLPGVPPSSGWATGVLNNYVPM